MQSHRSLFLNHLAQTSNEPVSLEIERAEGIYLITPEGKKIIDLIAGIAVSNVGHSHPKIIEAVREQAAKHMHVMVYGELVQAPQVLLAERLAETTCNRLDNAYFVNSGSEAVEAAMKLAKRFTGRTEIIALEDAYHGSTHGALSLGSHEEFKSAFRPLVPDIRHIRLNNLNDLSFISDKTAAVIIELIQGEAGVKIASPEFVKVLRDKCDATGALLIFDEIQTGFGRTGKFWAWEHYDILPDILLTAKGMGGGMPLGALLASKETMSVFKTNPVLGHITTFGGHPVSCAASLAALEVVHEEKLTEKVPGKAALFEKLLIHNKIKTIRSKGLMLAVEFEDADFVQKIIKKALENGLMTDWFLYCDTAIRIAPPLIITEDEIRDACERLISAVDAADLKSKQGLLT